MTPFTDESGIELPIDLPRPRSGERGVAYYNEFDPKIAAWLQQLINEGLIAPGVVDTRDIKEVSASELEGFTQCHFFAGIGGWSLALRMAGWPDERLVWTGSCPCQPWSNGNVSQGGGKGRLDSRHTWPAWFNLIEECRPPELFGEQVANAIAKGWWDDVCLDLERAGYAVGEAVLPAYSVQASHKRDRLFWLAHTCGAGWKGHQQTERISRSESQALPLYGDPIADSRRALAGDYGDLLPCDGVSVQLERDAIKGYGNAIVPQVAAEFIAAYLDTQREVA